MSKLFEEYKDPEFLRARTAQIECGLPTVRDIFNAGAYRVGVPPEERDPAIMKGLEELAVLSEEYFDEYMIGRSGQRLTLNSPKAAMFGMRRTPPSQKR